VFGNRCPDLSPDAKKGLKFPAPLGNGGTDSSVIQKGRPQIIADCGDLVGHRLNGSDRRLQRILGIRERTCLYKLIAEGHRNKAIADHLYISLGTVRTRRANIMKKLNAHNVSDLTALAMQKGLISE